MSASQKSSPIKKLLCDFQFWIRQLHNTAKIGDKLSKVFILCNAEGLSGLSSLVL